MDMPTHPSRPIIRLGRVIVALVLSLSLGMYMLYDPRGLTRGAGPVFVAGLDGPTAE